MWPIEMWNENVQGKTCKNEKSEDKSAENMNGSENDAWDGEIIKWMKMQKNMLSKYVYI